jgi:hypothetical protein
VLNHETDFFPLLLCFVKRVKQLKLNTLVENYSSKDITIVLNNFYKSNSGLSVAIDPNFELGASRSGQELELRRFPRGSVLRQVAQVDQRQETSEVKVEMRNRQQQQEQERN